MADSKPGILRNLRIKRVALVDNGANFDKSTGDGAHIMLFKRDINKDGPALGDVHVPTPSGKPKKDEEEKPVKKNFITKLLGIVTETDVEKRKAAAIELEKEFPPDDDDKPMHKADDTMCKCADCVTKRTAKLAKEAEGRTEVEKAMESVRTEMQKSVDAANARADEAVSIAKAERETRLNSEMHTLLKSFKATPINLETDVAVFRKMQDSDKAGFDRTMAIMKAADAQMAESALYRNMGSGRDASGEGSAWAQIEAQADSMVEKSTTGMTKEAAIDRVLQNPKNNKLVKQYRAEQQ